MPHHLQHHEQVPVQLHPSVDPSLLPMRWRGLGIWSTAQCSSSAFLASATNSPKSPSLKTLVQLGVVIASVIGGVNKPIRFLEYTKCFGSSMLLWVIAMPLKKAAVGCRNILVYCWCMAEWLEVSHLGLQMDEETTRVAVGLTLGSTSVILVNAATVCPRLITWPTMVSTYNMWQ